MSTFARLLFQSGNGTLTLAQPISEPPDSFSYDPANPVPTVGGRTLFYHPRLGPPGVFDQAKVEEREDVLVYTSEPLTKPLSFAGNAAAELFVSADVASLVLGKTVSGVTYLCRTGALKAKKVGGTWQIDRLDLERLRGVDDALQTAGTAAPRAD